MTVSSRKTANSLLWSGIESGSLVVISLGSLVVYSRLLSASEFGLFSIVFAIADLLSILVTMLFHDALVQRRNVSNLHFDTAFTVGMAVSIVLMGGCWVVAPIFMRIVQQPDAGQLLGWVGLMFPCLALSATIAAEQRRQFAFKSLAVRSLAGRILGGITGVGAAFLGAGVWSLLLQQIVTAFVGSLVLWFTCERAPRLRFGRVQFAQLIGFGMYSVGSQFLSFSIKRLFSIFAGLLLGVAAAGYLNLSFRVVDMLWAISATAVAQVSLPMLAGLQSDPARLQRAYKRSVEFACLVLYPCFTGIAVVAPEIVDTVFGPQWAPAVPCVAALAVLVLTQAPRLFATPILTAVGRPKDPLVGIIAELVFMLAVVAVFGMPNLSWAIGVWLVSECIPIPIMARMVRKATGCSIADQFIGAATPLLAAAVMALVVSVARSALPVGFCAHYRLAVLVLIGAATYLLVVLSLDRKLIAMFVGFVRSAFGQAEA